ncbi:mitochondrial ribosomal protein S25-domain-containing protein [Collybia nuda]|uniref:Small ribosomal subunit protein mS23 n=1 Tax=Collybia nuda TaxID=64659 RepID=A0A9P6CC17_9AGAR|nr:mitochondrial ribosomal protein S25-domain-containing protein [Collybia nuda]
MVRRIASQVHQQVSRLMNANYIKKQPAWFQAVLDYPPLPLPPKAPPSRTQYDQQLNSVPRSSKPRPHESRPLPIYYLEDDIRRQFFRDHPFEAFRPTTLVEGAGVEDSHPVQGKAWTRLRQRGRNPTPEDAIRFTLNQYQFHSIPIAQAYSQAVAQFRSLRSEHHIATTFSTIEAEHLGAVFSRGEIEHAFEKEKKGLVSFERREELDEGAIAARKRWRAIVEKPGVSEQWTKGEEYVRLWKEGVRPSYAPVLTQPVISEVPTPEEIARTADFMQVV